MHRMGVTWAGALLAVLSLFSIVGHAADTGVSVSDAWSRATVPGQSTAGVWFSITSKQEAKLLAVSSPLAGSAQVHTMLHENGMMKMRALESLDLPAGKVVELAPGGNHVMLQGLSQPLNVGDHLPLSLSVEFADKRKETLEVIVEVRAPSGERGVHEHHGHAM